MIYLDSSVVLAYLLAEDRCPPVSLWDQPLASSRLLEYEVWNRIHRKSPADANGVRALLARVQFTEMTPDVLSRALAPFPVPVRTLDSLHLATAEFLRRGGDDVVLASFDGRMLASARALHIPIFDF